MSSSATARVARRRVSVGSAGAQGNGPSSPRDLRRRALRRLSERGQQPRSRGHERATRHLPPRAGAGTEPESVAWRRTEQRRQQRRLDLGQQPLRRILEHATNLVPGTQTPRGTSSCATGTPRRPPASAWAPLPRSRTATAATRRSPPTAATSRSTASPRTSWRGTRTPGRTPSCTIARSARPPASASPPGETRAMVRAPTPRSPPMALRGLRLVGQ